MKTDDKNELPTFGSDNYYLVLIHMYKVIEYNKINKI